MRISKYLVLRLACGLLLRKDVSSGRKTRHEGTCLSILSGVVGQQLVESKRAGHVMGLRMLQDVSYALVPYCWIISDVQLYHMDRFME
jgi:hypothetical protein